MPSWNEILGPELEKPYFQNIISTVKTLRTSGKEIYPPKHDIFRAFELTPFDDIKVVILGQDPYHGQGQANGLAFSVNRGISIPPSLANIYKELKKEFPEMEIPDHGDLTSWTQQGVLLLNTSLTVEKSNPGCHLDLWKPFTGLVIKEITTRLPKTIFLLWGKNARKTFEEYAHPDHYKTVYSLVAAHPSPYSANAGFFGCNHFFIVNDILKKDLNKTPIDWTISK